MKAIAIISTDWHIKPDNIDNVKNLIGQQIELAESLDIKTHICLGDVFQSRQSQPLANMIGFFQILQMFRNAGHNLIAIAGNHDKTDYKSENSFLMPYIGGQNFKLVLHSEKLKIGSLDCLFIPYFSENIWVEAFKEQKVSFNETVLFSHIAVTGSTNNDGQKVENEIKPSLFADCKKVFLGHYHNYQQIGDNIHHLPAIQATNFGENNEKGFTVLYDDSSFKLHKSKFKEFHTIAINLAETGKKELNAIKKKYAESENNIRFKLIGDEGMIKSINKEEFESLGIRVETEMAEFEHEETVQIKRFDASNIVEEFSAWCKKEGKSFETGFEYLKKTLKL